MAFLVTGVGGTNMPCFFPHQANASFYCPKGRKSLAEWVSVITQIAANFVIKRTTRNHICFCKNNEIETNSYILENIHQQAPP